jgi:hypothetical protein
MTESVFGGVTESSKTKKFCPCCSMSIHRHIEKSARWYCRHCDSELCELQVKDKRWRHGMGYAHSEPFCPGLVVKR